jgi:CHAT domain-containing protein
MFMKMKGLNSPLPAPQKSELRRLVWAPIEEKLAGCDTVFLVPDGSLTGVPWVALPGREPGSCLLDQYTFSLVSHPQHLYELARRKGRTANRLLAVGGVDYGKAPAGWRDAWTPLKSTLSEAEGVVDLARGNRFEVVLLTGDRPTVDAVLENMPVSGYIHLATHGHYFDPKDREVQQTTLSQGAFAMAGKHASITARNPLTLSVLAMAGANRPTPVDPRGLLIAERVAELDLGATRMVVLSACETGLGEVTSGEGVFGLQRAFGLAGARSVVGSLWPVPDKESGDLMKAFYRNLWERKLSPPQALREAQQLVVRAVPAGTPENYKHYLYAAWVLSGDPGTLLPAPPPTGVEEPLSAPDPAAGTGSPPGGQALEVGAGAKDGKAAIPAPSRGASSLPWLPYLIGGSVIIVLMLLGWLGLRRSRMAR